jgi:hypothetical protein
MMSLSSFPDFRAAMLGWGAVMKDPTVRRVSTALPADRDRLLLKFSAAFNEVMRAAIEWANDVQKRSSAYGLGSDRPDVMAALGPHLVIIVRELIGVYGVMPTYRHAAPPCWSDRYESYIHGAVPMYSLALMRVDKTDPAGRQTLPERTISEGELQHLLQEMPHLGFSMNDDEAEARIEKISKGGTDHVIGTVGNIVTVYSVTRLGAREPNRQEQFISLIYNTAATTVMWSGRGAYPPTLYDALRKFFSPSQAEDDAVALEQQIVRESEMRERDAVSRAYDARKVRSDVLGSQRDAELGLEGSKPKRPVAAERRKSVYLKGEN